MATITIMKVLPGLNNQQLVTFAATNDGNTYYKLVDGLWPAGDTQAYANANATALYQQASIEGVHISELIVTAYIEAGFKAYYGAILKSVMDDTTNGTLGLIVIDAVINNAIVLVNSNAARSAWLNKYRALLGIGATGLILNPAGVASLTAAQKANLLNVILTFATTGISIGSTVASID